MLSDYTFLTDHSYSLRPDNDELLLNPEKMKNKKRRGSSNRINKTTPTANRTVSIDRSSSDKENSSLNLSSLTDVPILTITKSGNKNKSSTNKKKSTRSRLSTRTAMPNSRTPTAKKQDNKTTLKTGVKSTQSSIVKKKNAIIRGRPKSLNFHKINAIDVPLSLSIEERVKLRRTTPFSTPIKPISIKKSRSIKSLLPKMNHIVKKELKQSRLSKTRKDIIKPKKFFLGSGLDLDNIVLGNRQRRSVQT